MVDSISFMACDHAVDHFPTCSNDGRVKVSLKFGTAEPRPMLWGLRNTFVRVGNMIPEKLQIPAAALLVIAVILVGTFASPTTADNNYRNRGISIAGLVIFYIVLYITSANRKKIVWRTVLVGLFCQYMLALFVLRTQTGYDIFNFISFLAR